MRFEHLNWSELPASTPRLIWAVFGVYAVIAAVVTWLFASDHAEVGIALLVAVFILPEFVIVRSGFAVQIEQRLSRVPSAKGARRRRAATSRSRSSYLEGEAAARLTHAGDAA